MGIDCGFARVYVWDTKSLTKHIKRRDDEQETAFKGRLLDERYRLYMEHFENYPRLDVSKSKSTSLDGSSS